MTPVDDHGVTRPSVSGPESVGMLSVTSHCGEPSDAKGDGAVHTELDEVGLR